MRALASSRLIFLTLVAWVFVGLTLALAQETPTALIRLTSGETLRGWPAASKAGQVAWRATGFADDLAFPKGAVSKVDFPNQPDPVIDPSAWRLELVDGGLLFVDLVDVDAERIVVESARCGRFSVNRSAILRLVARGGKRMVYQGPNGAHEWSVSADRVPGPKWDYQSGRLFAAKPGARAWRDLGLAQGRSLEFELSWKGTAKFGLFIGTSPEASTEPAIVMDCWDSTLVAYRETTDGIEVRVLDERLEKDGVLEMSIEVGADRVIFRDADGGELGSLSRPTDLPPWICFENRGVGTQMISMKVSRASHEPRGIAGRDLVSMDRDRGTVVVGGNELDLVDVDSIEFGTGATESETGEVELFYQDGAHLRGRYEMTADGRIHLRTPWAAEDLSLSTETLESITFKSWVEVATGEHELRIGGRVLRGELSGWSATQIAPRFKPSLALSPVALSPDSGATIKLNDASEFYVDSEDAPHVLFCRNEDVLPVRLLSMKKESLEVQTPFGATREIPISEVKAIELAPRRARRLTRSRKKTKKPATNVINPFGRAAPQNRKSNLPPGFIDAARRARLLAMPRKYTLRPLTHLVIARNGDVLRGRLISLAEKKLVIRSGRRDVEIPRELVVAVIWLHPPAPPGARSDSTEATPDEAAHAGEIQLVLGRETRVTLTPTSIDGNGIVGRSDFFGDCRFTMDEVIEVLVGDVRGSLPNFYADWVLAPMPEPVIE